MPAPDKKERHTATASLFSLRRAAFCTYLLGFVSVTFATGQNAQTISRTVVVNSDPPGAIIWKKEGRDYTCVNTVTPGTVELTFHGANDLQKIRLRRFGFPGKNLDIKSTDERIDAALGEPAPKSFLTADDAPPDVKQLNSILKTEFEKTLLAAPEAFRCVPFELKLIKVMKNKDTQALTLGAVINLDRSFGGPSFRSASHAGIEEERRQKLAQATLEGGIADLLAWLRHVSVKFPDLKVIIVTCMYSGTETSLHTERVLTGHMEGKFVTKHEFDVKTDQYVQRDVYEQQWVSVPDDVTTANDEEVEKSISFIMPVAEIPDTGDKKAVSDAVFAGGKIVLSK